MNNSHNANGLLALNIGYFIAAAAATIYVTAESWHWGFWQSPFPIILTLVGTLYVSTAIAGLIATKSGVHKFIAITLFVALLGFATYTGSYFVLDHSSAKANLVGIMLAVLLGEISCVALAWNLSVKRIETVVLSVRTETIIRWVALLLPLPIFAYAALSLYVRGCDAKSAIVPINGSTPISISATKFFVHCERFLFGLRRADDHFNYLARKYFLMGNWELMEIYAKEGVANAQQMPLICLDTRKLYQRLVARQLDMSLYYWKEGKPSEAHDALVAAIASMQKYQTLMGVAKPASPEELIDGYEYLPTIFAWKENSQP